MSGKIRLDCKIDFQNTFCLNILWANPGKRVTGVGTQLFFILIH